MASFDTVNYSLRPSKSIQRQLFFEGIQELQKKLDLENLVFIGFGSIWFTDFVMAHKLLRLNDMVSIEANDVGYKRAVFNVPYATVRVMHGFSYDVLPTLYSDALINKRPWLVWLDYDYELNESVRDEIRNIIENAPSNSIFAITFNGMERKYGTPEARPKRLQELLGSVVPDDLDKSMCKDTRMQETLADLTLAYMNSVAADLSRPGGFVPAFKLVYKDSSPMITVGGILPAKGARKTAIDAISETSWPCYLSKSIKAPHLTNREAAILQSKLPSTVPLTRLMIQSLGFDLEEDQILAYETYYKQYPAFAQILA